MVKASAPGKVHLIGEHSVVYGKPAIIAAIGKRIFSEAERAKNIVVEDTASGFVSRFEIKEVRDFSRKADELWNVCSGKGDFSELFKFVEGRASFRKAMFGKILEMLGVDGGVSLKVWEDIPVGAGLGSSAAFALAIAQSTATAYGLDVSRERLNEIAYATEQFIHGKPSGGDNSACCFGGLVWFQKGNPNIIKSLKAEVPYELENFVLVYIKKPEKTTGELVQHVMGLEQEFRNERVNALGSATYKMLEALKAKDFDRVKELINLAQKNLSELGVSIPEIDRIAEKVRGIGGAAKLCGAGGGGTMLCYHEDKQRLVQNIKKLGYEPIETGLGVEGVRIESI